MFTVTSLTCLLTRSCVNSLLSNRSDKKQRPRRSQRHQRLRRSQRKQKLQQRRARPDHQQRKRTQILSLRLEARKTATVTQRGRSRRHLRHLQLNPPKFPPHRPRRQKISALEKVLAVMATPMMTAKMKTLSTKLWLQTGPLLNLQPRARQRRMMTTAGLVLGKLQRSQKCEKRTRRSGKRK